MCDKMNSVKEYAFKNRMWYNSKKKRKGDRYVELYFSYIPVDGILTKTEEDSALYGARYEFDTQNLNAMSSDLVSKLTSLYGEPSKITSKSDIYKKEYTYTYWYGANDTVIVLKTLKKILQVYMRMK